MIELPKGTFALYTRGSDGSPLKLPDTETATIAQDASGQVYFQRNSAADVYTNVNGQKIPLKPGADSSFNPDGSVSGQRWVPDTPTYYQALPGGDTYHVALSFYPGFESHGLEVSEDFKRPNYTGSDASLFMPDAKVTTS